MYLFKTCRGGEFWFNRDDMFERGFEFIDVLNMID